ncbi:MAG: type II toxin-antitoxin system antitoxin [Steroidobacteraceae bacterium]
MATGKTSTLTFRIEPALKEALRTAAEREHRSIANMVEVLIRDYCDRHGITIPARQALLEQKRGSRSSRKNT